MTFKCGQIWAKVLKSTEYIHTKVSWAKPTRITRLLDQLKPIFYSKSKWLKMDGSKDFDDKNEPIEEIKRIVKESYRIEFIPSKLFLEFLLFVATQIRDTRMSDTLTRDIVMYKISCLGTLARQSDQESVLNIAQETNNFFMITTEQTTNDIFQQILAIYKYCGVTFTGNISISHIIGQLCEGITGTVMEIESSQSTVEPTMNVRSEIEKVIIERYKARQVIVQPSPPGVKSSITKPTSSIRNPPPSVVSRRPNNPQSTDKPICEHGSNCYRKNTEHSRDFYHPGRSPHQVKPWKGGRGSKSNRTRTHRSSAKRTTRHTRRTRHRRR